MERPRGEKRTHMKKEARNIEADEECTHLQPFEGVANHPKVDRKEKLKEIKWKLD